MPADAPWWENVLNERNLEVTRLRTRLRQLQLHAPALRQMIDSPPRQREVPDLIRPILSDITREVP